MTKISNREKNLLYFLLVICVVLGGYKFLIEPQMVTANTYTAKYAELEMEKELLDLTTSASASSSETYEGNLAILEELQENIGAFIEDEALDTMMTNLIVSYGLEESEVSITQGATGYIPEGLEAITAKTVTMNVSGTETQFIGFQEEIQKRTDCIISNLSIRSEEESNMDIVVVVYMQAKEVE